MKLITRYTPIAVHFGSLDTRVLQLSGNRNGWKVRVAECAPAQGRTRHSQAVSPLSGRLRGRVLGRDAVISTSAAAAGITVVPVDRDQENRLRAILEEAAMRSLEDSEGIGYRYLPLANEAGETDPRQEYLLLSLGQSELRRCTAATDALGMRAVGLELSAFPLARCLQQSKSACEDAWGFLHLGFDNALFGIVYDGELRFLKPMQCTASDLLEKLQQATLDLEQLPVLDALQLGGEIGAEDAASAPAAQLAQLCDQAEQPAAAIQRTLRLEAQGMAQEARACLRHFTARHPGTKLADVQLTGFGAGLPEMGNCLELAMNLSVRPAQPFTDLGIEAPQEILDEEHLWCGALGLALRQKG